MDAIQITSGRGPLECELAVGLYLAFFLKVHPGAVVKKEQRGKAVTVAGRQLAAYKSVLLEVPDARQGRNQSAYSQHQSLVNEFVFSCRMRELGTSYNRTKQHV